MKALVLVKCLRLRHVLVRLPGLLSTLLLYKEFYTAVVQLSVVTNLFYLLLFLASIVNHWRRLRAIKQLRSPASREVGFLELGVISYLYGTRSTPWKMFGDREPRQSSFLQLVDRL